MNKYEIAKQVFIEYAENSGDDGINFQGWLGGILGIDNIFATKDEIMVSLSWEGGRGWDGCEETFICPREEWERFWKLAEGKECYLGEIAGKHSEIYGTLDDGDISITKEIDYTQIKCDHSMLSGMGSYFEENLEGKDAEFAFNFISVYGEGY